VLLEVALQLVTGPPPDDGGRSVAVALTPAGTLAAALAPHAVAGVVTTGVGALAIPAAGGPPERSLVGGGFFDAESLVSFPLTGGAAGLAWLEGERRLVAAVPGGVPGADPPVPGVQVGSPGAVRPLGEPLSLPVTCSAACDVRVQSADRVLNGELSLTRAGRDRVLLDEGGIQPPAQGLQRRRLRVIYGAPGARHPRTRTMVVRWRDAGASRPQRIVRVRAVRRPGGRLRIAWTTDVAGAGAIFFVTGSATRGGQPLELNESDGGDGRRFACGLRRARDIHFVTVTSLNTGQAVEARVR
jgi:hypothetical protein